MVHVKKNKFKPRFKKIINLKIVIQNKQKILKFKKKKWDKQKSQYLRLNLNRKRNCYYKFYDQRSYTVPRFMSRFTNKFRQDLRSKRRFNFCYGYIGKSSLLTLINKSVSKTKHNKTNLTHEFISSLESKLDTVLVRSGFALNMRNARQLICHGHVKINNNIMRVSSSSLKIGDKIEFSQKVHPLIEYRLGSSPFWPLPPKYLQVSYKIFQILIVSDVARSNFSNSLPAKLDFNTVLNCYV
jgi:small subunit ribosomal protein S4